MGSFSSVLLRTALDLHGVVLAPPRADSSGKEGRRTVLSYDVALGTTLPLFPLHSAGHRGKHSTVGEELCKHLKKGLVVHGGLMVEVVYHSS